MQNNVEIGVADLLRALSRELALMSVTSEQLQTILATACASSANGTAFHRDAQLSDVLTQSLIALTDFLARIANTVPVTWTIDITRAARELPLAALAAAVSMQKDIETAPAGELEVFT